MSMTSIIFVLVILLFGFDSAGQVESGRKHTYGNDRTNREAPAISETGANHSNSVPAESFKPMITPKRTAREKF